MAGDCLDILKHAEGSQTSSLFVAFAKNPLQGREQRAKVGVASLA